MLTTPLGQQATWACLLYLSLKTRGSWGSSVPTSEKYSPISVRDTEAHRSHS